MKFCTITLGCKANQFDTSTIEGILTERGHTQVRLGDGCDICVINTCAVTAESVRKSRQAVRRVKKLEPNALIAVCGCFSELEPETVTSIGADLVGGADNREDFAFEIERASLMKSNLENTSSSESINHVTTTPIQSNRTRALLKIQDGCDNYCAYCIIPFVRGRSRSTPLDKLTQQASKLEKQGYKEIIITGIEISSWKDPVSSIQGGGQSDNPDTKEAGNSASETENSLQLIDAITAISEVIPSARLRIGSLDPSVLTAELIEKLAKIPNLCNHFHISLQSGCDETLQRMGRKYKTSAVKQTINKLRENFPDCGITADLIVGFPGETDDEFNQTLDFITNAAFSDMHIFPFSPRPGTRAADMPFQLSKQIIKERAKKATEIAKKMAEAFKTKQLEKTVEVLFEQEKNGYMVGHSGNYLEVAVEAQSQKLQEPTPPSAEIACVKNIPETNSIHHVKIKKLENGLLIGELLIDKRLKN